MYSKSSSWSFLIRVFSDQNLLPVPRDISSVATPFIASEHQGIRRKLLFAWFLKFLNFQNPILFYHICRGYSTLWAIQDLNLGPHPYQGCALTNWANSPNLDKNLCVKIKLMIKPIYGFYFPKRRWSSRTFQYGYLVTTSPQSLALP